MNNQIDITDPPTRMVSNLLVFVYSSVSSQIASLTKQQAATIISLIDSVLCFVVTFRPNSDQYHISIHSLY